MKEIENKLERKASPSQIYPFLKQLEKSHYIESKGRAERDKKVYHLTRDGRKFASSLSNSFSDLLELAVKQKLTKCAHCECEMSVDEKTTVLTSERQGRKYYFCSKSIRLYEQMINR